MAGNDSCHGCAPSMIGGLVVGGQSEGGRLLMGDCSRHHYCVQEFEITQRSIPNSIKLFLWIPAGRSLLCAKRKQAPWHLAFDMLWILALYCCWLYSISLLLQCLSWDDFGINSCYAIVCLPSIGSEWDVDCFWAAVPRASALILIICYVLERP